MLYKMDSMIWRKQQPGYTYKYIIRKLVYYFPMRIIPFMPTLLTSFEAISFLANSAGDAYAAVVLRLIIGNAERREKATVESVSFAIM